MKSKEITIIGATGKLGIPVSLYLSQAGFKVTVVARDINKAEKFFRQAGNISIVKGDLKDPESLKSALKNTEYLYLNLSTNTIDVNVPFAEEREGVANVLKAVSKDVIQQIIMISGLGAFQKNIVPQQYTFPPNFIRSQGHELLKKSGIPYTILHCSWFIDSFIAFQRNGVYSVIGSNNNLIYFTNAYDYSQHLANAIGNINAYNKEYPVQGKEGFIHSEAAKIFLGIYSPKVKVKELPDGIINIIALFNKEMKLVKAMSSYFKHSKEVFQAVESGTYKDLGEPKLSLKEYAEKLKSESYTI